MTLDDLQRERCIARHGKDHALDATTIAGLLAKLPGWSLVEDGAAIGKAFAFDDFHRTMAFVNAVAWIAHAEDHHPDFEVGYSRCTLRFSTHDVGGLSRNDFICAAKVERLLGHC